MSVVTAVRYLAEFAAEALRPWDPTREKAAVMLADLPLMVRLREDDSATADEVTHLVLGRFAAAELPSVPGVDFAPKLSAEAHDFRWVRKVAPDTWQGCCSCGFATLPCASAEQADNEAYTHFMQTQADAATLVAEAVAVLDDCTCDLNLRQVCDTCQGVSADRPLVDVPAPVTELPAREGKWRFGDACGPEHTYRDACQYAAEAKS